MKKNNAAYLMSKFSMSLDDVKLIIFQINYLFIKLLIYLPSKLVTCFIQKKINLPS